MVNGTSRMRASVCASSVLPRAGRADQQDVRLGDLDVVVLARRAPGACSDCAPRPRAPAWRGPGRSRSRRGPCRSRAGVGTPSRDFTRVRLVLLADDVHAELDAFIADEHGRPGDQLPHLVLALAAEASSRGCSGNRPRTWRLACS